MKQHQDIYCNQNLSSSANSWNINVIVDDINNPKGAAVPSLGLSNKAIYNDNNVEQYKSRNGKDQYPQESYFNAIELNGM